MTFVCAILISRYLLATGEGDLPDWFWPTLIGAIVAVVLVVFKIFYTRKLAEKSQKSPFPFKAFKDPDELKNALLSNKALTLADNKYVQRKVVSDGNANNYDEDKILITGRAETGKTRYAFERVKEIYDECQNHGSCAIAYSHRLNIEPGTPPPIPEELKADNVIIFLDDVSPFLLCGSVAGTHPKEDQAEMKTALSTLEDHLKNFIKAGVHRMVIIVTARNENVEDDISHKFWRDFKRVELEDISNPKTHNALVSGMARMIGIDITPDALEALYEANKGYSLEAVQVFLQNRKGDTIAPVEKKHVDKYFKKEAHEQWLRETYKPLEKQKPQIEFVYKALGCLAFDYGIFPSPRDLVVNMASHLCKGQYTRRKIDKAITFLTRKKNALTLKSKNISCPDYQLVKPKEKLSTKQYFEYACPLRFLNDTSKKALAAALFYQADKAYIEGFYQDAVDLCNSSCESYPSAITYFNMGVVQDDQGDHKEAIGSYWKAIEYGEKAQDWGMVARAYNNMGVVQRKEGSLEKVIGNYLKAIEYGEKAQAWDTMARAYNNMGVVQRKEGSLKKAIENYLKAIEYGEKAQDWGTVASAYSNMGNAQENQGDAIENYLAAIKHGKKAEKWGTVAFAYHNMGNVQKNQGNLKEAIESYLAVIELRAFLPDDKVGSVFADVVLPIVFEGMKALSHDDIKEGRRRAQLLDALYEDAKTDGMEGSILDAIRKTEKCLETDEQKEFFEKFMGMVKFPR